MTESEFASLIDCAFPYDDARRWRRLWAMAPRISSNAAFMVVHEVCRTPRSEPMNRKRAESILGHLKHRFRHPAMRVIDPAVRAYLSGGALRPSAAARLMRKLANHPGQHAALAICYFSANDQDGALEQIYGSVVAGWKAAEAIRLARAKAS